MKTIGKVLLSFLAIFIIVFVVTTFFISNLYKTKDSVKLVTEVVEQTIPFHWSSTRHILVDVKINNSNDTYPFLLDSGASTMVFGNLLAAYKLPDIGNSFSIGTSGGFLFPDLYRIDQLEVAGISFKDVSAASIDQLPMHCSDNIYGILGKEAMQHLVWQIDFKEEKIIVTAKKEQLHIAEDAIVIPLKENQYGHQLYANATLGTDDKEKRFTIDLGSNGYSSIKIEEVASQESKIIEFIGSSSTGLDGDYKDKAYLQAIKNFKIGSLIIPSLPIYASNSPMNLLGLKFFKNFRTTISWKDKELILEPYKEQNFKNIGFGFSAKFEKTANALLIKAICKGLQADSLGIRPNDKIVSLNGIAMNEEADYCSFSYKNTKQLSMELERDGISRQVTLRKLNYFPETTQEEISME